MGYDVHITRAEEWVDSEEFPITIEEWVEYVRLDPEMRLDNVATAFQDGEPLVSYQNDGLAVWTAYSQNDVDGNLAWFDYGAGEIVVKNPDDEIIEKMKQIAAALNAKVLGDDGESY